MMDEQVALANDVEDRAVGIAQLDRHARHERRISQLGNLDGTQLDEVREIEQRTTLFDVRFAE